jgi:hypothetical protein
MQIGIVAKKIGLSVDAIRFYERNAFAVSRVWDSERVLLGSSNSFSARSTLERCSCRCVLERTCHPSRSRPGEVS